jgi:hypothetical protein
LCYLYIKARPEDKLSRKYFYKDHKGRTELAKGGTDYQERLIGAKAY